MTQFALARTDACNAETPHSPRHYFGPITLFHGLTTEEQSELLSDARLKDMAAKTELVRLGHLNDFLYFLLSGTVRLSLKREGYRATVLNILGAGEVLGDISALDRCTASASVWTLEQCRFLVVQHEHFISCLWHMPRLALNLLKLQSHRMRRLTAQTEALTIFDTGPRVARQLLLFAADYGVPVSPRSSARTARVRSAAQFDARQGRKPEAVHIPLRLTQGDLASLCGSSRKQVNRAMSVYLDVQAISIDRGFQITILDPERLRQDCLMLMP